MHISLSRMNAEETRGCNPLRAEDALRRQLIHCERSSTNTRARIGNAQHVKRPLQDAVLAVFPVQRIEHDRGMEFLNLLGKRGRIQLHADGGIAL